MSASRIHRGKEYLGSFTSRMTEDYRMPGTLQTERHHLEEAGLLKPDQTILQYSLGILREKAAKEKEALEKQQSELVFPTVAMFGINQQA